ncbi:MAG: hypothetical protein ACI9K2_001294 [Myxococcota bacterium]
MTRTPAHPSATRRELLLGVLGGLVAALSAPPAQAASADLVAHIRDALLGFDGAALIRRAADDLDLPGRWRNRLDSALDEVDLTGGFRRLQDLDSKTLKPLLDLGEEALGTVGFKLWLLRLTRRTPADAAGRAAMVERVLRHWFKLDMPRIRAGVAELDRDGLAIVYGPVSDLLEASGVILHEPFAAFLQLVHGRKATEHFLARGDPARALLERLFSHDHTTIALVGHGTWTSFELVGYSKRPKELLEDLCDRLLDTPRETLLAMAKGSLYYIYKRHVPRGSLQEEDLARLFDQVYPPGPERDARLKTMIIRHTCGAERYATEGADLLWKLAPAEVEAMMEVDHDHFSAASPSGRKAFETELAAWLSDKDVPIIERPAFGTCLVRDPSATRGYEGISWMADFIEEPVPAHMPAAPIVRAAPEPTAE